MLKRVIGRSIRISFFCALAAIILTRSTLPPGDKIEQIRAFTRNIEFNFVDWMLKALGIKLGQASLAAEDYLSEPERHELVVVYLKLVVQISQKEAELSEIYADPNIEDPESASQALRQELDELYVRRDQIQPVAEAILQDQMAWTAAELGLTLGGQPVPPVLYHSTPLPTALIVSPREAIRQDADISLEPGLTVDERDELENKVDTALDVSSLVVGIGGVGVYPTMVMQTSDLNWLAEVVAHEWIHNFLTLRPLGVSYFNTPELRIMNETTASIAGKEIGRALIERYYPELLPPPPAEEAPSTSPQPTTEPPAFDFRKEMHTTRVRVDELLAQGKVEEAEDYMEQRRVLFWDNGYLIRKLNQAYFAFYGAYADQPGGPAGADPVGTAVRALRAKSKSLGEFIYQIAWMSSFEELQKAVDQG